MLYICFAAKFTEFPRNVTATEGQNVEMSCAFQSGSASVYLEIQWWFLRAAEDQEAGAEVTGTQVLILCHGVPKPPRNTTGEGVERTGGKRGEGGGRRREQREALDLPRDLILTMKYQRRNLQIKMPTSRDGAFGACHSQDATRDVHKTTQISKV